MSEEKKLTYSVRSMGAKFETREAEDNLYIEGYFSVFDTIYKLFDGGTESVAKGAFTDQLDGDVRALIDHETRLVLGRTTAGTLELKEDDKGLWGRIKVNPKDQDAMNLYERVKRGDVNQCSFGFDITDQEIEFKEDDSIHWTIKKVKLYEVSVCTFPAYEETSVKARMQDLEQIKQREAEAFRKIQLEKLKGAMNA